MQSAAMAAHIMSLQKELQDVRAQNHEQNEQLVKLEKLLDDASGTLDTKPALSWDRFMTAPKLSENTRCLTGFSDVNKLKDFYDFLNYDRRVERLRRVDTRVKDEDRKRKKHVGSVLPLHFWYPACWLLNVLSKLCLCT